MMRKTTKQIFIIFLFFISTCLFIWLEAGGTFIYSSLAWVSVIGMCLYIFKFMLNRN